MRNVSEELEYLQFDQVISKKEIYAALMENGGLLMQVSQHIWINNKKNHVCPRRW